MDQLGLKRDPAGSTSFKNMKRNQILSVVGDEFGHEEFSDDSSTWVVFLASTFRADEISKMRPQRIKAAIEKITELYG